MNFYEDDPKDESRDDYFRKESERAIESAVAGAVAAGKTLEEIRSAIRRSYPFGPLRRGKSYKIWNRMVLAKEKDLGLAPRKHRKNREGSGE